jgi:two-component system CheB/CheR fusion protein
MLLGSFESIGRDADLFESVSKKWRVFQRIDLPRRALVDFPIIPTSARRTPRLSQPETTTVPLTRFKDLMQRIVLSEYVPAAALINSRHEILCVLGPLADFLEFPFGEMTKDLLAMARPGLRTKIRAALRKAIQTRETVVDRDARVKRAGGYFYCSVTVKPLVAANEASGLLLITFQNRDRPTPLTAEDAATQPLDESVFVQQLEFELKSTREDLQSTIEQHEDSTEELKASNEEILSMNEELQSANEELEASKEELQSLTEELNTVNSQLQDKVEELDRSNSDLINLIDGSEVATVFLDTQLHINRFTPHSAKLLNLQASDIGRRFSDFAPRFTDATLLDDCRKVLKQGQPIEKEVWSISEEPESRCYLRRVLAYKSKDDHIEGVLITFVDITMRLVAESQTRRLASVLWDSNDAVIVHDFAGRIISWNRGAEIMFGYSAEEAKQVNAHDLAPPEKRDEFLSYISRLKNDVAVPSFETQRLTKNGRVLDVELSVTAYRGERGELIGVATTERDVTQRKRTAAVLYETEERSKAVLNTATDAIITINHQGLIVTVNPATKHMFGYSETELLGQNINLLMHSPDREDHDGYIARYVETDEARMIGIGREVKGLRKDGTTLEIDLAVSRVDHLGLFTGIMRDITPRKQLQKQVLEIADDEQRRIGQELHDGTGQELTGLSLFACTLVDMLHEAPENSPDNVQSWSLKEADLQRLRQTATRLSQGIVEAHRHVQQLSHGIMPMQIEVEGLTSALAELANSTDVEQKLRCRFNNPTPVVVANNSTATHLYRIAQEAVNNAVRHSRADQILITLSSRGDKITLEVIDNGVGIASENATSGVSSRPAGFGLKIMDYRAGIIGGKLRVTRRNNGGTSVTCVVRARGEG